MNKETICVNPEAEFVTAIYAALAEWTDHVQLLIEHEGKDLRPFLRDERRMREFIQSPLQQHWSALTEARQLDLRHTLQYLLNLDEHRPYVVSNQRNPDLREKKGALSQHYRDGCQNALVPYDGYALCQWMWEILFDGEDWHTDISNWVVVDTTQKIQLGTPDVASPAPERSFLAKLFGKK